MQDPKTRVREKTSEEAAVLADFDSSRDPKEFLREIYKEAYNNQQDGLDQVSKVMMKFSALLVRLSADHERIHRSIRCLTVWLVVMTIVLTLVTVLLGYEAYLKIQKHEQHSPTATHSP